MERTKTNAALLALLPGVLGVHRFFVGRNGSGVAYLVPGYAFLGVLISWLVRDRSFEGSAVDVLSMAGSMHDALALYSILCLVLLLLISWVEAIRFFSLHEDRFRQLYISDAPRLADPEAVHERMAIDTPKKRVVAMVLGVTLGWIGVQRFYLGRPATGVLGLLLGLTGLGALVAGLVVADLGTPVWAAGAGILGVTFLAGLVDGLRVLSMQDRAFRYRYGKAVEHEWLQEEWKAAP